MCRDLRKRECTPFKFRFNVDVTTIAFDLNSHLSVSETTNSSEKQREFGILAIKIWSSCLDTTLKELLIIGNIHLLPFLADLLDECQCLPL